MTDSKKKQCLGMPIIEVTQWEIKKKQPIPVCMCSEFNRNLSIFHIFSTFQLAGLVPDNIHTKKALKSSFHLRDASLDKMSAGFTSAII